MTEAITPATDYPKRLVILTDADGRRVALDPQTSALPVIDHPHSKIHAGEMFTIALSAVLGGGQKLQIALNSGATKWNHVSWSADASMAATVTIKQEVATLAGGTTATPQSRNQADPQTPVGTAKTGIPAGPLTFTGGTALGSPKVIGAGLARAGSEWVVKPNVDVVWEIESSGLPNTVNFEVNFYQEDPS